MSFFKSLFKDLFSKEELQAGDEDSELVSEQIVFTEIYWAEFKKWQNRGIHQTLLEHLFALWENSSKGDSNSEKLFLHQTKLSNGFYFLGEEPWSNEDYSFLIQYWIEKLKDKGYVQKRAHRELCEEGGLLKGMEEFYLKPGLKFRRSTPFEQLFGNIHIQHRTVNGETRLVKLLANTYSDRNYKTAYDFEDLIHFILLL